MQIKNDRRGNARRAGALSWIIAPFLFTSAASAGNMLTDWNTAAATTIVANGGKSPGASAVWFSYSSLAVYDAVNAITGQYAHFYYHFAGRPDASIDAAAARRVLTNFFPSQKATLDSQLSASLAGITGGVASVAAGVRGWGGRCRHRR